MTKRSDEEIVMTVACLTEDRDPAEQRAMLAVALRLDGALASFSTSNPEAHPPRYVNMVDETYMPADGKRVEMTGAQRAAYQKLVDKWTGCDECGAPAGVHPAEGCPRQATSYGFDLARLREIALVAI